MEKVDLGRVIQQSIARFNQNRRGARPLVFATLSASATGVPWSGGTLQKLISQALYESLFSANPEMAVEISLRRRHGLKDLEAFVRVQPSYWVQLRISGRGLRPDEHLMEDLFAQAGYRCEEWVGTENAEPKLGIFGPARGSGSKLVFCLESRRALLRCDFLLPVTEDAQPDCTVTDERPLAGHQV